MLGAEIAAFEAGERAAQELGLVGEERHEGCDLLWPAEFLSYN